jgi:AcrR family transcriptional regulator
MSSNAHRQESNIAQRRAAARGGSSAEYLERRAEMVQAASRVFKERGFRGTTLKHVAEAMGVDRASLYYYVSSKDELFQEIVSEAVKVNLTTAKAIRAEDAPAPEKLRRLIESLMISYADYYPVFYVLIQENLNHVAPEHSAWAQRMRRVTREYEEIVMGIVREGQRKGTLRDAAPAWLIAYEVIGIVGWTNRWFNPNESPVDARQIGSAFADILLDGLVADGP